MASLNQQQAGRDAEDYDNDRKDGRYAAGGDRAHWFPAEPRSTDLFADLSIAHADDIRRINAEANALFDRLMAPKAAPRQARAA